MRNYRYPALWLLVTYGAAAIAEPAPQLTDEPTEWEQTLSAIELIVTDRPAARLAAAEQYDWSCWTFELLHSPPEGLEDAADEALRYFEFVVLEDSDEVLADRIAALLADCTDPQWSPLFLELLAHPSLQRRWRAMVHFTEIQSRDSVATLEDLWDETLPTWIRTDLIEALNFHNSSLHAEDSVELLDSDDPRLARAAVRTVEGFRPDGALEQLLRHASSDESSIRSQAVSALAAWSDDEQVMRQLIDLTREGSTDLQEVSIQALSSFRQRAATDRLLQVAADLSSDSWQRFAAIGELSGRNHPAVIPTLLGILDEPPAPDVDLLKSVARARLADLGVGIPEPIEEPEYVFTPIRRGYVVEADGEIAEPPDGSSVRCWAAPHTAGDPAEYERLPSGELASISDHFISDGEHWVEIDGDCWIPRELLVERTGRAPYSDRWPFLQEFDVGLEEIDSEMGRELLDAGMIRLFDIEDAITGVLFEFDAADAEAVEYLTEINSRDDSLLSYAVSIALDLLDLTRSLEPEAAAER